MGSGNPEKWLSFYRPFFGNEDQVRDFVASVETLGPDDRRHAAKIMMHQTLRLVSLADKVPLILKNSEALQLLFLLVCAEHIAKLADNYDKDGKSQTYVQNFFSWFLSPEQQQQLSFGITGPDREPFTLQQVVKALYDVRCDVVHEGKYWDFQFKSGDCPLLSDMIVSLTLAEFRWILVMGCIKAIQTCPMPKT